GVGEWGGRIGVVVLPEAEAGGATGVECGVWARATGPLAGLPARQIENALHEWADGFFSEFCAVVQAKHGLAPNLARTSQPRRQHVFLRPASLAATAKRPPLQHLGNALTGRAASALPHRASSTVPVWAWAAMILFVALLLYAARWFNG
ncbi:carbon monoxide dehydrogenase, partial [Burkholderia thailandensis]|nr:carbon monoxide dehydrogenase [Burkholderia thailandensis]